MEDNFSGFLDKRSQSCGFKQWSLPSNIQVSRIAKLKLWGHISPCHWRTLDSTVSVGITRRKRRGRCSAFCEDWFQFNNSAGFNRYFSTDDRRALLQSLTIGSIKQFIGKRTPKVPSMLVLRHLQCAENSRWTTALHKHENKTVHKTESLQRLTNTIIS